MTTDNSKEFTSDSNRILRIWPYQNEKDTLKAADQYTSLKSSPSDRRKILEKLFITDDYFLSVTPILLASFHRMEGPTRHQVLDNIIRLIISGQDFSSITDDISKLMSDSNYKFREKATDLMLHMGDSAYPATARLVSNLRSKVPDIQLSAIKVISAIGPICAEQALPKLKTFARGATTEELKDACHYAIKILKGEEKPLRPVIKIEGVVENEQINREASESYDDEPATAKPANSYPAIKGKVIVIADDEQGIRSMMSKAISACGANTKEVGDGETVLKLTTAKIHVDLFILDLMMPKKSGAEVLKVLRESPQYALTPVFIVSARTERSIMLKMAQLEIAAYFTKPFKLTDLLKRINTTFEQS